MSRIIEELQKSVNELFSKVPVDIDNSIKMLINNAITKLDLVTRDELDYQNDLLNLNNKHLEDLSIKLNELEKKISDLEK